MQSAEAVTPEPTYGTSASSSRPCTVPSSPNGPCSTGKTTSTSVSAPAATGRDGRRTSAPSVSPARELARRRRAERPGAGAVDLDAHDVQPEPVERLGDAARRGDGDLVLARAAAREHRDAAAHGGGVCGGRPGVGGRGRRVGASSWPSSRSVGVGRQSSRPACVHELADEERDRRALLERPLAGSCASTRPSWLGSVTSCVSTVDLKPASSSSASRVGERVAGHVRHVRRLRALRDRDRDLRAAAATLRAGDRSCAITIALRLVGVGVDAHDA